MSSDQLFLITAAAGNTGAPTVEMLLDAGHRVRAFVHRSDRRSEALAGLGAEIVEGDLLDFHAVSSAMSGVSAAYFCYPIAPGSLLPATAIFAQAARRARLVIIDAPPILSDVTGIALSRKASGVLLVVEAERTRAPIIEQARKVIATGGGRLLGVILNKRKHHIPGWIYKLL